MFTLVNMEEMDKTERRSSYHHGDLKNALTDAAIELAASHGPEQITVRAAAKMGGVTPTAAYRHFAGHEELLEAVQQRAMDAMTAAMSRRTAAIEPPTNPEAAQARFAACGQAYVEFAVAQPGLFRTAFCRGNQLGVRSDQTDYTSAEPYQQLIRTVDDLVRTGLLDESDRALTELAAWSSVHGLSMLLVDGPFRGLPRPAKQQLIGDVVRFLSSRYASVAGGTASSFG